MAASMSCEWGKKIKPLTMLSSNFHSIDFPMDGTLWVVGLTVLGDETIDWLPPAPISSAAKQRTERTG